MKNKIIHLIYLVFRDLGSHIKPHPNELLNFSLFIRECWHWIIDTVGIHLGLDTLGTHSIYIVNTYKRKHKVPNKHLT